MKAWMFLAIKDIMKRKRETLMVIIAIAVGVVGPVFTTALNNGFQDAFVGNTVNVFTGHLQIEPNNGDTVIANSESVVSKITGLSGIMGVAPRIAGNVNIESKTEKVDIAIIGIKPSLEETASTLSATVERGEFLDDQDRNSILVGTALAEVLKVDAGDKVIIRYKDRSSAEFRIKGIINTGTFDLDRYTIVTTYDSIKGLIETNEASNILIRLKNRDEASRYRTIIQKETSLPNVKTWEELSAGMAGMIQTFGSISMLTAAISIFVAAIAISLIIYTTVKNKTREIGMLKAIGARKNMILKIYLTEALFIGSIGTFLGTVFGLALVNVIQQNPIIVSPEYGMKLVIMPWISSDSIIGTDFSILMTCIIGGLYPAIVASKTNIIKAIWSG
jgi:putative ABC transport system permease protein